MTSRKFGPNSYSGYFYHSPSSVGTRHQLTCRKLRFGCHARLRLCTLNRRCSLERRHNTRSSLSLVLRSRLVRLPQTKFPRSRILLMMPKTVLLWGPTSLAILRYEHPLRKYPTTIPAICYRTHQYHTNMSTTFGHRRARIKGTTVIMVK